MTDFEQRLREAMATAVAGEQPPAQLGRLVVRRHRRRRAALVTAAASVVLAAVLPASARLAGRGGPPPAPAPAAGPHSRSPGPAAGPGVQAYPCAAQIYGAMGSHWRSEAVQAGSLWLINAGIGPGFSFRNRNGTLKAVPLIAFLQGTGTVSVRPAGWAGQGFRFLGGFDGNDQYRLRDGRPEAEITGCPASKSTYGHGLTEYYFGVLVEGPRCVTLEVRSSPARRPVTARLGFPPRYRGHRILGGCPSRRSAT